MLPRAHIAEQKSRDLQLLDFLAAFGDAVAAVVAVDVLERLVARTAHAAMHLQGAVGGLGVNPGCDKIARRAKFRFRRSGKSLYDSPHPVPKEGALAIVTERWDGMWWTRRHRARDGIAGRDKLRERSPDVLTSGSEAYGEIVWS